MEKYVLNLIDPSKSNIKFNFAENQFLKKRSGVNEKYCIEFNIDPNCLYKYVDNVVVKTRINTPNDLFKLEMVGQYLNNNNVIWRLEIYDIMYDGFELDRRMGYDWDKSGHAGKIVVDAISRLNPYKISLCAPISRWYVSQFVRCNITITDTLAYKLRDFYDRAFQEIKKCGITNDEILAYCNDVYGYDMDYSTFSGTDVVKYNPHGSSNYNAIKYGDKKYKVCIIISNFCSEEDIKEAYEDVRFALKEDVKIYLCAPHYISGLDKTKYKFEKIFTTNAHDDELKSSQDIDVYDIINTDSSNN